MRGIKCNVKSEIRRREILLDTFYYYYLLLNEEKKDTDDKYYKTGNDIEFSSTYDRDSLEVQLRTKYIIVAHKS